MADLIRMEHITKFYGRIRALADGEVHVLEREIVGLLGDNGAGKSTLIKVLSGAVPITSGTIYLRGKPVEIPPPPTPSPAASRRSIRTARSSRSSRSPATSSSAASSAPARGSSTGWTRTG